MTSKPNKYSESWIGQSGKEYREVSYWVGFGWQRFLQVKINGDWWGV